MPDRLAEGLHPRIAADRSPSITSLNDRRPTSFRETAERSAINGLRLREGLAFDEWVRLGTRLAELSHASAWYLGDWLRYGERTYGSRYKAALQATCFDYQTLRNYAWVAGRFPPGRRLSGVSFQHHAEVASLPEPAQDLWLHRAERDRWSRNELRRQLRSALRAGENDKQTPVDLRIQIPVDREHRWRQAATAASQDLADWLIQAADDAAERALVTGQPDVCEPLGPLLVVD